MSVAGDQTRPYWNQQIPHLFNDHIPPFNSTEIGDQQVQDLSLHWLTLETDVEQSDLKKNLTMGGAKLYMK